MDEKFYITPKGKGQLPYLRKKYYAGRLSDELNLDYLILNTLDEVGPSSYSDILADEMSIFEGHEPEKDRVSAQVRSSIRNLFESGSIDKVDSNDL